MERMNISLPDELKAQMDAVAGVNWSEIARDAFATALKIHQLREVNMEQAQIERLRASKTKNADREKAEGIEAGHDWALNRAEYDELARVVDLSDQNEVTALDLGFAIYGPDADNRDALDVLENEFDGAKLSDAFIEGFIAGASQVYEKV